MSRFLYWSNLLLGLGCTDCEVVPNTKAIKVWEAHTRLKPMCPGLRSYANASSTALTRHDKYRRRVTAAWTLDGIWVLEIAPNYRSSIRALGETTDMLNALLRGLFTLVVRWTFVWRSSLWTALNLSHRGHKSYKSREFIVFTIKRTRLVLLELSF